MCLQKMAPKIPDEQTSSHRSLHQISHLHRNAFRHSLEFRVRPAGSTFHCICERRSVHFVHLGAGGGKTFVLKVRMFGFIEAPNSYNVSAAEC